MSLERIEVTPFPNLLGDIITGRKTGTLTVVKEPERKVFHFADGELSLITSNSIQESLGAWLFQKGEINEDQALQLTPPDWTDSVPLFHEGSIVHIKRKDPLLREWMLSLALPLFSWTEGTAAFTTGEPLPSRKRAFVKSTPGFVLEGIRSIHNGLVLRRALGDIQRKISPNRSALFVTDSLPLTQPELAVASALDNPETIEGFIRRMPGNSANTGRVLIAMLVLGLFTEAEEPPPEKKFVEDHDTQGDLLLMASIGSDPRALKAVALARHLPNVNHYELLKVPQGAPRAEILKRAAELAADFDPKDFAPIVRDSVTAIRRRITEASEQLGNPTRRHDYDELLANVDRTQDHQSIQRKLSRRSISEQNFRRATKLASSGDFYGAIVLLKQAVDFAPDYANAWFLLGTCQQRNPQWHHYASESFQKALSINPNHAEALISLGDLFRSQGLVSRAESCYEEVLQMDENNRHALKRLGRKPPEPLEEE